MKKTTTDAQGVLTREEIDHRSLPNLIAKSDPFGNIIAKKEQAYDAQGNCIRTINFPIYQGNKENRINTIFEYGPCQKLKVLFEAKDESEQKVTYFHYNASGELERIIRSDEQ